jgi:hypothetical protein
MFERDMSSVFNTGGVAAANPEITVTVQARPRSGCSLVIKQKKKTSGEALQMHTLRQRRRGTKAIIQEWQRQSQQGPAKGATATRNEGEMKEPRLYGQLRRQVEDASRRIGYENIKAVHEKYSKGSKDGIKLDVFKQALSEVRREFEDVSDEEVERYFVEMDIENNGALDLEEFRHSLRKLFPIEQAVSALPLSRVIASSFPGLHNIRTEDHLDAFSKLQATEIAAMANAVSYELERLLLEMVSGLRMGFEVKSKAQYGSDAGAKFSVSGSVTLSGGRVEDFHAGLAQRVGEFVTVLWFYEKLYSPMIAKLLCRSP